MKLKHIPAPWALRLQVLVLGLILPGLMGGCSNISMSAKRAGPITVRVMTYNIQHGAGADHNIDLARTAAAINAEHPDIVALEEVDKGVERTNRRDLTA